MMRNISRYAFGHLKLKPLVLSGQSSQHGSQIRSVTNGYGFHVENPLETLVGSLAACQLSTMRALTRATDFKIEKVKFTKIESGYDVAKFVAGGKQNRIADVVIEAEIVSSKDQKYIDELMPKVMNSCPIYQMLTLAGVKITSTWKSVQSIP